MRLRRALGLVTGLIAMAMPARAEEPGLATAWHTDHATRARLVGGGSAPAATPPGLLAGIEITLDDGWKTYWRNPGSSGVPPRVDWAGSENLAGAELLFPAPERFADRDGDTIGYKSAVVLPIVVTARDTGRPVKLKLALEYGVCREVCVPVQPVLELELPPDAAKRAPGSALGAALARVPRAPEQRREGDPRLDAVKVVLDGDKPHITVDATFAGDGKGADVFMEAPDGLWLPLARPVDGTTGPKRRFHVDLTDGADVADLKGRAIRLTLVSAAGATETTFRME